MPQQFMIETQPSGMNFPLLHGQCYGATGFAHVPAITEFAMPDVRVEFSKAPGQILIFNMIQPKFLESGGVDDRAFRINAIKL